MNIQNSNFFANIRYDAVSGIIVFLITQLFCLSMALVSGAFLFSAIVAGITEDTFIGFSNGFQPSIISAFACGAGG